MARLLLILFALSAAAPALAPLDQNHSQAVVSKRISQPAAPAASEQNLEVGPASADRFSGYGRIFAADASIKTHSLSNQHIDELIEQGELLIALPGQPTFALTLTRLSQHADIQHLSLQSDEGLPSTISRRGDRFSASLATRTGTFKLRGNAAQTLLISNDELDWRMLPGADDSRRPA
ncbi:MAG: hypothetical protein NXH85_03040 [Pseudomonadaceae bacterium]|nr:hypothetical protein [Pseudomonadaceae bacterium]